MHPYMYMGRFVPKEGQNREKVTFYFVDTQELQPQPFKKRYYWYISRVRVVRAPSNSDVDFLLSQVSHSPFLRPLVLDFFSHFLTIASSVPTLTNK